MAAHRQYIPFYGVIPNGQNSGAEFVNKWVQYSRMISVIGVGGTIMIGAMIGGTDGAVLGALGGVFLAVVTAPI
jgi:hypothetical protein